MEEAKSKIAKGASKRSAAPIARPLFGRSAPPLAEAGTRTHSANGSHEDEHDEKGVLGLDPAGNDPQNMRLLRGSDRNAPTTVGQVFLPPIDPKDSEEVRQAKIRDAVLGTRRLRREDIEARMHHRLVLAPQKTSSENVDDGSGGKQAGANPTDREGGATKEAGGE